MIRPDSTATAVPPTSAEGTVRTFLRNLRRGDLEACCRSFAPTAVIDEAESLPFGGVRIGPDGFRDLVSAVGGAYALRLGPPAVDVCDNTVFVRFDTELTSRHTGKAMKVPVVDIYTVSDDGLITRLDVYYKDTLAVSHLNGGKNAQRGGLDT